ncbi:MAG: response regulator transcription factor [Actinomycetota bacterium]|nr:response regulator transcription factor [Actinomycetota bacterium]
MVLPVTDAGFGARDGQAGEPMDGGNGPTDWPRVRRVRVVLADDAADFRELMRHRLESDGRFVVVGEAANGREAVELAEEHHPDVVVMDLAMPVMDGLEAIGEVRDRVPDTKSVVLTSFDARSLADRATRLGAFCYLEKGTAIEDILTVLAPLSPPEFE